MYTGILYLVTGKKIEFEGLIFEDLCFGYSTLKANSYVHKIPENVQKMIIEKIKDNLEI